MVRVITLKNEPVRQAIAPIGVASAYRVTPLDSRSSYSVREKNQMHTNIRKKEFMKQKTIGLNPLEQY